MYRTLGAIVIVFISALALVGLTFSRSREVAADFSFVNGAEPKTLDPGLLTGAPGGRVVTAVFEGLTRREARTLEPAPGVAERWELSEDRTTYTFHLRHDAVWTDGKPVTAHDFVYAWLRLLDPKLGSEYSYILYPVRHAEAFHTFEDSVNVLKDGLAPRIDKLLAQSTEGVSARTWQRVLGEERAHGALKQGEAPIIGALLGRKQGSVTLGELREFRGAIEKERGRLAKLHAEAQEHLGRDAGVYANDDHTLIVELTSPTPYFLEITSFYSAMPVPRWVIEKPGNDKDWFLPGKLVSNGPFELDSWKVNERIRLRKSSSYWGREEVKSEVIDVLPIEQATTALNMYLTGATDWLPSNYPMDLVDQLKTRSDFYSGPGMVVYYYRLNTAKKPFDDPRVRKAFSLAIDRQVIVDDVLGLGQLPATGFVPPGMPGYDAPRGDMALDVPRARALLSEAGYPEGKGFPEVGILYNTMEAHRKIADVISDMLRKNLGVAVTPYNQEWQSFQATVRDGDYTIARAGWVGDYNDPNTFLDMWVTNGGNNQTGFSSNVYDRLIARAANLAPFLESPEDLLRQLKEPERIRQLLPGARGPIGRARDDAWKKIRLQLLREAEAILVQDELPVLPIYFYVVSGLVRPEMKGFYSTLQFDDGSTAPNLQDDHPLRSLWFDRSGDEQEAAR